MAPSSSVGTTNESMLRQENTFLPPANQAASATFTPLVSVMPAVRKKSRALCHSFIGLPSFNRRPAMSSVSSSSGSESAKWSGTIVAIITCAKP